MEEKINRVLQFRTDKSIYLDMSNERRKKGDLAGALQVLFSAQKKDNDNEINGEIAEVYAEMGLLDLSNQYWFYYLNNCTKRNRTRAYEELGINYFYLDNLLASGHYLHEKATIDGYLSSDVLEDREIIEFLSNSLFKKSAYRIVYPYEKADYSYVFKTARRCFTNCDFGRAEAVYARVPGQCMTEDAFGEYAMSCFLAGRDDRAIEVCKESLRYCGENTTAYCCLTTIYASKKEKDKCDYYYKKALENRKGDKEEVYKLASCSLEKGDYVVARECLSEIVKEKPYDIMMTFFYGLTLVNGGEYEKGKEMVDRAYRLNPKDEIVAFYSRYIKEIIDAKDKDKYLPITVVKEYPDSVVKKFTQMISKLHDSNQDVDKYIKKPWVKEGLFWGVLSHDDELSKKSALVLGLANDKGVEKRLKELLIRNDIFDEVKRLILFTLVICDKCDDKLYVLAGYEMLQIKQRKLLFKDKPDGMFFLTAYAYAVSRLVFIRPKGVEKLGVSANKIFKALSPLNVTETLTSVEVAMLMINACNIKGMNNIKRICKMFNLDVNKVEYYAKLINGEIKND